MKMTLLGCRPYDFKDEQSGRQVAGLTLYYSAKSNDESVQGRIAGKLGVSQSSPLYCSLTGVDFSEPFEAEVLFDLNPSSGKAVLSNIQFLDDEASALDIFADE